MNNDYIDKEQPQKKQTRKSLIFSYLHYNLQIFILHILNSKV